MKTLRSMIALTAASVCGGFLALPVAAHHSTAIYDSQNPIELNGTVVEWKFTNPHCIIRLEAPGADGKPVVWSLEGSNTAGLSRQGWTPETLKKGDKLVITVRPLRSGAPGGNYSNVRWAADGKPVRPRGTEGAD
jgi:hypothetical protein